MRIGGGQFRGRTLRTPKGDRTRPTSGLVRETLFNILSPDLPDARFLDLFAGCGSVGLEALSRGAYYSSFVEKDRIALECLRGNISALQVEEFTLVLPYPAERALEQLKRQDKQFDMIFLDPPFHQADAYQTVLEKISSYNLLAEDGTVIAQHDPRVKLPETIGALTTYRQRDMGDNVLTFYHK